jgi:glycosyltransferase involved in cell wall biosynthesis
VLAARFPRLHVAIAGRGELEASLRHRAAELNVVERLHLLGLRSDIGSILAAADVFVLPSLSEGIPIALLEAMLAERPIVATAVGDVPTVLDGGRAGVLVPPGDATALATALGGLLNDPAEARRVSAAAVERATLEYSFARMIERYAAIYAELLAPSARTPRSDPVLESPKIALGKPAVGRQGT